MKSIRIEKRLDEKIINDSRQFVWCDYKECSDRGFYPRCYFDIYRNCDLYKK